MDFTEKDLQAFQAMVGSIDMLCTLSIERYELDDATGLAALFFTWLMRFRRDAKSPATAIDDLNAIAREQIALLWPSVCQSYLLQEQFIASQQTKN